MKFLLAAAAATLAGIQLVHAASSVDDFALGPVIARGKGVEVHRGQLDDAFISYRANLAARGQSIPEERRQSAEAQLLDRMIITQLLVDRVSDEERARAKTNAVKFLDESRKAAESEEAFVRHLKSLGMTLAQLTNSVLEQAIYEEVVTREVKSKIAIPDDALRKFYDTNGESFTQPEIARASHILVATRDFQGGLPLSAEQKQARHDKAQKLLERARKGEDFAKLALENSDDPSVKDNKGEYTFTRAKDDPRRAMVPEFEKAAFSLKPGEVSDIVTTDYGYHIIKLHEIIPAKKLEFAEVKDRIREHLVQIELDKRLTSYFNKLKQDAGVEITDDRLRAAVEKINSEPRGKIDPMLEPRR